MMMSCIYSCRNKIGAELHIHLEGNRGGSERERERARAARERERERESERERELVTICSTIFHNVVCLGIRGKSSPCDAE
jgi:hypothetical protein